VDFSLGAFKNLKVFLQVAGACAPMCQIEFTFSRFYFALFKIKYWTSRLSESKKIVAPFIVKNNIP
jgi:hypothetical protein